MEGHPSISILDTSSRSWDCRVVESHDPRRNTRNETARRGRDFLLARRLLGLQRILGRGRVWSCYPASGAIFGTAPEPS
jgi:hypothetical protein